MVVGRAHGLFNESDIHLRAFSVIRSKSVVAAVNDVRCY